jgi:RimJ/RimL family protein N-acetyltransferase
MAGPGRGYDDVQIRDVEDADLEAFFEFQRDPVATGMAAVAARARGPFAAYWAGIRADQAVLAQTIVVNGEVVGHITCWEQWGEHQVGYWIGRRHWGRGVATTALALFLCQMTSRPLYAYVAAHNTGSLRVLEKCGFRRVDGHDGPPSPPAPRDPAEVTLIQHILES